MAWVTSTYLAIAAIAASAAGSYVSYQGQKEQASQQRAQNALAERRANLEANRKKRELYRQTLVTRSQALATSTNQGASGSSAQGGALGDISNSGQYNVAGVNIGQDFSGQNSAINSRIGAAGSQQAFGAGLSSLGNSVLNNSGVIGRVIS